MSVVTVDGHWDGENEPTVFIDMLGQQVRVGDHISYAITYGRSANITIGRLLSFRTVGDDKQPYTTWGPYDYSANKRGPTIPLFKMRIQPLLDSPSYVSRGSVDGTIPARPVFIASVHNVLKVDTTLADLPDW